MENVHTNSLKFAGDPDRAWAVERVRQKVESVPLVSGTSPKPPGHTRFICISGDSADVYVCYLY